MPENHKLLQELSLGESLSLAFRLYYKNFIILAIPYLVVSFLSGVLFGTMLGQANAIPPLPSNPTPDQLLSWFSTYWVPFIAAILGIGIFIGIAGQIVGGVIIKCASDLIEKGSTSFGYAFRFTLGRALRLIAASIIVGIAVGLGSFALIIPGMILSLIFSLVNQTIMIENAGVFDGLSRSIKLVGGRWLKTFAYMMIIVLLVGIVYLVLSETLSPLATLNFTVYFLILSVLGGLATPLMTIAMTVYYYSMAAREERAKVPAAPPVAATLPPSPPPPP